MSHTRLELPDGWADIRDPKKVAYGRRKPVNKAGVRLAHYRAEVEEWEAAVKAQAAAEAHPEIIGAVPIDPEPECQSCSGSGVTPDTDDNCADCGGTGKAKAEVAYLPTEEEMEMLEALQEATTVALTAAWSWEHPVSIEGLQELPSDAAGQLINHCSQFMDQLFLNTSPTPDESSPTTA